MEQNINIGEAIDKVFLAFWRDEFKIAYDNKNNGHAVIKKVFMTSFSTGFKFNEKINNEKMVAAKMTLKDINILIRNKYIDIKPESIFFRDFYARTKLFPELKIIVPAPGEIR